jgi:hypothetical protein
MAAARTAMRRAAPKGLASGRGARGAFVALALAGAVRPGAALAGESSKRACIAASEQGQDLRHTGHLRAAREALLQCTAPSCPDLVRQDCSRWLGEVLALSPSVVIGARTTQGQDVTDVVVTVDGQVLTRRLDGKAATVDPGVHAFHFEAPGFVALDQRVLVREGEQNRILTVSLRPAAPAMRVPAPPAPDRSVPALAWGLGALGVASLGAALALDVSAFDEASCKPRCSSSAVTSVKTRTYLAGSLLGVGVAAVGAAVLDAVLGRPSAHASAARQAPLQLGLSLGAGGGTLQLGGPF